MSKYPEHEKLKAIKSRSQVVGEFMEWLRKEKGISFAKPDRWGKYEPVNLPIQATLAEFFEIDQKKLDEEKEEMLKELRASCNH